MAFQKWSKTLDKNRFDFNPAHGVCKDSPFCPYPAYISCEKRKTWFRLSAKVWFLPFAVYRFVLFSFFAAAGLLGALWFWPDFCFFWACRRGQVEVYLYIPLLALAWGSHGSGTCGNPQVKTFAFAFLDPFLDAHNSGYQRSIASCDRIRGFSELALGAEANKKCFYASQKPIITYHGHIGRNGLRWHKPGYVAVFLLGAVSRIIIGQKSLKIVLQLLALLPYCWWARYWISRCGNGRGASKGAFNASSRGMAEVIWWPQCFCIGLLMNFFRTSGQCRKSSWLPEAQEAISSGYRCCRTITISWPNVEILFIGSNYGPEKISAEKQASNLPVLNVRGVLGRGFPRAHCIIKTCDGNSNCL